MSQKSEGDIGHKNIETCMGYSLAIDVSDANARQARIEALGSYVT